MPTDPRPAPRRWFSAALLATLWASSWPALSQSSPYYLAIAETYGRESNLYRVPDGVALAPTVSRSDTIWITSLAAGLDQTISRQRLRADLTLRDSRFTHNEGLNNHGQGLRAIWDWATVDRLAGTLAVLYDRSLVRFDSNAEAVNLVRNISSTRQIDASARVGLVTRWSAEASYSHLQVDYSAPAFASREFRQDSYSGLLRYQPGGSLSASFGVRAVEGRYPRFAALADGSFVADHLHGRFADLGIRLVAGGSSQFDARLSAGHTRYDRATGTNSSGLTGSLLWNWRPSGEKGRTRLDTRLWRDRGLESVALGYLIKSAGSSASGRFADFSRTSTGLSISAAHDITAKLGLTATISTIERDLRDTRLDIFGQPVASSGADRSRQVGLGLRWQATRSIVTGCDISHERRTASNSLSSNLGNLSSNCFAQLSLS